MTRMGDDKAGGTRRVEGRACCGGRGDGARGADGDEGAHLGRVCMGEMSGESWVREVSR